MVTHATLDSVSNILHIYYARYLTSQSNDRTHIRDMFPKESRRFDGSVCRLGLLDSYPTTGGPRGPGATIPTSSRTHVETSDIFLTYHYYPIEVDWDIEEQSSGPHSWIRASAMEVDRVRKWALINFEMQACGDGSGILAGESNPAASNLLPQIVISDVSGGPYDSNLQFTVSSWYGIRFKKGMRLEFWKPASDVAGVTEALDRRLGPTGQSYFTVALVTTTGGTTTVIMEEARQGTGGNNPGAGQTSVYDYVAQEGAIIEDYFGTSQTAANATPGLKAFIGDGAPPLRTTSKNQVPAAGTMQGINPTTSAIDWKSPVIDAEGTRILGPSVFEEVGQNLQVSGSEGIDELHAILTHPLQVSQYRRTLYPQERYTVTGNLPSLPGGAKSSTSERKYLQWGHLPIIPSRFIDPDRAYFVNWDVIKLLENTPFKFAAADGSMWQRDPSGRASYRAVAYKYEGAGIHSRNRQAVAKNLSTTAA